MTIYQALLNQADGDKGSAKENLKEIKDAYWEILNDGGGYEEIEELLYDYGLEPDYIMDLL